MKKIITFTIVLLSTFQSCRQSEDEKIDLYRHDLQTKSESAQRNLLSGLTVENRIKVWQSKLDQILDQKLTDKQHSLVVILKDEVENLNLEDYDGIKLIETGIEIAKITPQDEYIRMFSLIGDYTRKEDQYVLINNEFILKDLQSLLGSAKANKKLVIHNFNFTNVVSKSVVPDCNCYWTCGFYNHTSNCKQTAGGCGFFNISDCNGYA